MHRNCVNKVQKYSVGAAISRPKRIESEQFVHRTHFRRLAGGW